MKITNIKSSTVIVESNGIKVLCDPWLFDGEYYGSWYHYPPLEVRDDVFQNIDYIYLSHIHPDHFSRKTFNYLDKNIPIIIHRYEANFLRRNLENLGFEVIELVNAAKFSFTKKFSIQVFAADNCNPELCGKFFGCGILESKFGSTQIDSLAVFSDDCFTLLNVNDCPYELSKQTLISIKEIHPKIDFLLVGYAGAGPYPQCFNMTREALKREVEKKQNNFLIQAKHFIQDVSPRYFMPFAGTYLLGGLVSLKNSQRGIPDISFAKQILEVMVSKMSIGILLNDYESFNLTDESCSKTYEPIVDADRENYIVNVLSLKRFDYEFDPMPLITDLIEFLPGAFDRFLSKSKEIYYSSDTKVVVDLVDDHYWVLDLHSAKFEISKNLDFSKINYLRLTLDNRLLLRILKGPKFAHWNNASIGSHISFDRNQDRYDRGLHYCLNFLHN